MRKYLILVFSFLLFHNLTSAQDTDQSQSGSLSRKEKRALPAKKGELYIVAMPIIGINPAFGFMYGAGAAASSFLGDPETTSISSAMTSINYTTKNQLLFYVKSTIYTENNGWILNGDWRFLDTSLPTYGGGTGPQSAKLASNGFEYEDDLFSAPISGAQDMSYTQIRFYETASRSIKNNMFVGFGYHLDLFSKINDKLLDTASVPPVLTSFYAYNEKYGFSQTKNSLSGISLNFSYDTRDNQNNAYKGQYATVSFRINQKFLGSDKNSSLLFIEYRKYLDLTKNHHNMLCFWGMANFVTSGSVPYMVLPAIGEDQYNKSGRGYAQGRFRGQSLIYGEAEFRKHLFSTKTNPDFFGFVLFANAITATNKDAGIGLFKYVNVGGGTGIRIMISKKPRTNFGIDYGWGNYGSSGIYLKLNEAF
jgi:outer membrane protein assembly factor BamA